MILSQRMSQFAATTEDFGFPKGKSTMKMPELVEATQDVLAQGLSLLFELGDHSYSKVAGSPFHASIGQHFGHILGHFRAVIRGTRAAEINYHGEESNPRLECEVTHASIATCDVLRAVKRYTEETLAQECRVISGTGASQGDSVYFKSTIARELAYCIGRASQHYDIIRLICDRVGVSAPREFGSVRPTLRKIAALAAD